jgi:hypothetical protein
MAGVRHTFRTAREGQPKPPIVQTVIEKRNCEITGEGKKEKVKQDAVMMIRLKDSRGAAHQPDRGCASQPQPRLRDVADSPCQK